jgi:hypothetical protein
LKKIHSHKNPQIFGRFEGYFFQCTWGFPPRDFFLSQSCT